MCVRLSILYVFNFSQHTPVVLSYRQDQTLKNIFFAFLWLAIFFLCLSWPCIVIRDHAHDMISGLTEQSSLGWFGHEVPDHISGWTPYQCHVALCDSIGDKEKPNVYLFSALTARSLSIFLQNNRAPGVLKQNVVQYSVSLSLQKIPGPKYCRHGVIIAYQFSLCRAAGVEFFLLELTMGNPRPKENPPPEFPRMLV